MTVQLRLDLADSPVLLHLPDMRGRYFSLTLIDAAGDEHEADVIVWATGFYAARFVSSLDVRGVGGARLRVRLPALQS